MVCAWYPTGLTLNLTAMGESVHIFFKGFFLKKSLSVKNRKKYIFHGKLLLNLSLGLGNVNLCLFSASEQAEVLKKATLSIYHLSRPPHFHPHPGGGVGWQGGWGDSCQTGQKSVHGKKTAIYSPIVGLTDL